MRMLRAARTPPRQRTHAHASPRALRCSRARAQGAAGQKRASARQRDSQLQTVSRMACQREGLNCCA